MSYNHTSNYLVLNIHTHTHTYIYIVYNTQCLSRYLSKPAQNYNIPSIRYYQVNNSPNRFLWFNYVIKFLGS